MRQAFLIPLLSLATTASLPSAAQARNTVAIAPLASSAGSEYQWIGPAIADALSLRVHQQSELNALTLRQVNAAMRHDNLTPDRLNDIDTAVRLGRQLGADIILIGSFSATWPDVEMIIKVIDPQKKKLVDTHILAGGLDNLIDLEARAANALALALGAKEPDITPGAFGSDNLRAWRASTLGFDILNWQSLAPRASDPNAPLKLPKAALQRGHDYMLEATKYDPDYGQAWAGLGVAQALLGDMKTAWKSLGKATALGFGHHPTAVLGASFVRMRQGRWDDAAQILQSAISRHPGFLHARGYLGQLFNHQGRHREALAQWEAYSKAVPNQPWVLAQRGYTKSKLKDSLGAIEDTIAALNILPDSPSLLLELASRYIDANKLVGAEDALLHAMKLHPSESNIYVRLGYVYLLQGKFDLAIPITEKALINPEANTVRRNLAYAHINLTRAYGHKGDLDRAFAHLKKAKDIGLASLKEVHNDPKLASLRADPRYEKLQP